MRPGISWVYEPEQKFVPAKLDGNMEFFASQVLRSGRLEILQPMREDRVLVWWEGCYRSQVSCPAELCENPAPTHSVLGSWGGRQH